MEDEQADEQQHGFDASASTDGLTAYLRSWNRRLLTHREELELARRRDNGDPRAAEILVERNLRLVYSIARRYMNSGAAQGIPFDDLIQDGTLGLIRASEKFDWRKGFRFSTYATWWIRQAIERTFAHDRTIRLTTNVQIEVRQVQRAERAVAAKLGREATVAEIAAATKIAPARVEELRGWARRTLSIDQQLENDDGDAMLAELAADGSGLDDEAAAAETSDEVQRLLGHLKPRHRHIVERRYGLNGQRESTLEEVASELGITRERVRQLQRQALEVMRMHARKDWAA